MAQINQHLTTASHYTFTVHRSGKCEKISAEFLLQFNTRTRLLTHSCDHYEMKAIGALLWRSVCSLTWCCKSHYSQNNIWLTFVQISKLAAKLISRHKTSLLNETCIWEWITDFYWLVKLYIDTTQVLQYAEIVLGVTAVAGWLGASYWKIRWMTKGESTRKAIRLSIKRSWILSGDATVITSSKM